MEIERLERVAVAVKNIDEAIALFSKVFGFTFVKTVELCAEAGVERKKTITEHGDYASEEAWNRAKVAISPIGLEVIESDPPVEKEGVRSFHFKVSNLEQAKAEMKEKGIRLVAQLDIGLLKEAIYSAEDLCGCRIVLTEYATPTVFEAETTKKT